MRRAFTAAALAALIAASCSGSSTVSPTAPVPTDTAAATATPLLTPTAKPTARPSRTVPPSPAPALDLFRAPVILEIPGDPQLGFQTVTLGDFDADGYLDIATANNDGTISVLLGAADGAFGPARDIPGAEGPAGMSATDLNGDGDLDLVVAHAGVTDAGSGPDDIVVLLGKGDGTFEKLVRPAGVNPEALAIADFNGDTRPDLATANHGDQLSIFIGLGDGTFEDPLGYAIGAPFASGIAAADFNADGDIDLVTANSLVGRGRSDRTMSILLGRGDGTFGAPETLPVGGPQPVVPVVGDLNGDGAADLVFPDGFPTRNVSVFIGRGDGAFSSSVEFLTGANPHSLAIADFDGDGYLDLATGNLGVNGGPDARGIAILFGIGDGTFAAPAQVTDSDSGTGIGAAADLDGDGKIDLVVISDFKLTLLFNDISR